MSIVGAIEAGLREVAARHRVTLSTVLEAAWAVVLSRFTGRADVVFGCLLATLKAITVRDRVEHVVPASGPRPDPAPLHPKDLAPLHPKGGDGRVSPGGAPGGPPVPPATPEEEAIAAV